MYCTVKDVEQEVGAIPLAQLTDEVSGETTSSGIVEGYINEQTAYINSFLTARYAIPLDPVDPAIKSACKRLTIIALRRKRNILQDEDTAEYDRLTNWLRSIRNGDNTITSALVAGATQTGSRIRSNVRSKAYYLDDYL